MELEWVDGSVDLRCPVCAHSAAQRRVARIDVPWRDELVDIVRCVECGAVVLGATLPPSMYTDADWDYYIEQIAGVNTIADTLVQTGFGRGARMLDVGCGYGFALDLARFLFDWKGIGLDPSIAAARGKAELGLDIRPGMLDDAFDPEERFDVIFSSEVIEHIADPREFLAAARRRLSPDGVLVLTTPDADAVTPDTPWTTLYPVLSVGNHEFLVNADGFERLLREAGFHAKVWNVGPSLRAVAAHHPGPLESVRPEGQTAVIDLVRYADERAASAAPGSALALGMATRRLKWAMSENMLDRASAGLPALRSALLDRYQIDIDDPESVVGRTDVPAVLTIIFFNLGLLRMWHERSPQRGAACFAAAASAGAAQFERHGLYQDPETPTVEALARGHLALAFARFAPEKVDAVLAELDQGMERGAGNTELVAELRARVQAELAVQRSLVKRTYRRARAIAGTMKRRLQNGVKSGFLAR
ncbi:MAG: class I SAM-dependent methyltransferase [Acidimicrobiia bacterium]|nr:class I SAM-dependent methyltransferase [Acidimicrobiia bacterium]